MRRSTTTGDSTRSVSTLMHALEFMESVERGAAAGERTRALEPYGTALDDIVHEGL